MRSVIWSLMATVALAGCSNSSSPSSGSDASSATNAAPQAHSVSGTVSILGNGTPSQQDKLVVSLVDMNNHGGAPLATKTIAPATFPQQFELDFNTADVAPNDLYVVQVELTDGDRHYTMSLQPPVLTQGHPTTGVTIAMQPEKTPGEKLMDQFKTVQSQIGGMKRSSGTKLDGPISRAWQVFRDGGQVKFIRELVDSGDKGFTSTDFAYKDGKPWVVQQQKMAHQGEQPSAIDTAGWGDDGSLVLKTHQAGSNTSDLSDSDAADLQKEATEVLGLAGGKGK